MQQLSNVCALSNKTLGAVPDNLKKHYIVLLIFILALYVRISEVSLMCAGGINFNRRGEITDRTSENQHLRMMHLNLLPAIIIYWNTKQLSRIINEIAQSGIIIPPEKLTHLSPLGWQHIILTGYYKW